jgi:hypothetical protein
MQKKKRKKERKSKQSLNPWLTYNVSEITAWSRFLSEKLTVTHIVTTIPILNEGEVLIFEFWGDYIALYLGSAGPTRYNLIYILILSSHLRTYLLNDIIQSYSLIKFCFSSTKYLLNAQPNSSSYILSLQKYLVTCTNREYSYRAIFFALLLNPSFYVQIIFQHRENSAVRSLFSVESVPI